jgi:glycosyltransferase involved in cell wall biosynthesis
VGHVGRFFRQKNHDFLLDVFERIVQKREKSALLLVGDGELLSGIKEKVEEKGLIRKVIFAGTRSDVNKILSAFDVFVFPSFYEGMPNTVIEAEANGLPCVISSSITNDAKILNNIIYISLDDDPEKWANTALSLQREEDATDTLKRSGYDIQQCVAA